MIWQAIGRKLRELLSSHELNEELFQDLEDAMIEADMGVRTATEMAEELRLRVRSRRITTKAEVVSSLKELVGGFIKTGGVAVTPGRLTLLLVLGVNGVGKTTTIAKLAHHFKTTRGVEKILLVAGDTFRAAAIDQLSLHAKRLALPVTAQEPGADPGAVIFDALESASARGMELVIADTAGRLHNKEALVRELMKIDKIVRSKIGDGSYQRMLVVDATTGQNALQQAEVFNKAVGIDSIVLAKADSTAKGGMVVPICRELGIPISFIGLGEKMEDLIPFDAERYLQSLFGP